MRYSTDWKDYELIDCSSGEKLERWTREILVRPDPQVIWKSERTNRLWFQPNARYVRSKTGGGQWQMYSKVPAAWQVRYKDLTFNIKTMGFKHTGLFPEQAVNWDYVRSLIKTSGRQNNTLIYATSNRRHLIKENFSDRENDVNRSDTLQEELSLSDRFGLSVTFINPDKAQFFDIVEKIALDRGLKADIPKLLAAADTWALRRGGRSPRCAKQFIDYVEGCEKRDMQW